MSRYTVEQQSLRSKDNHIQGCHARKVNCGRVYSAYKVKTVLFGRN